jgi:calcineurin-like phosphoesterase family protein
MILFYGDVHGDLRHVLPTVKSEKPVAIILLGDIQAQRPLEQELSDVMKLTEVYFIHGNHDTDSKQDHDNLFNSQLADRNLHGRIIEIDGLRVAGLGGIFRSSIWWTNTEAEPAFMNYEEYAREGLIAERWKLYRKNAKASMNADDWKQYQKNVAEGWVPDLPMPELEGKALTHKSTIFYEDWFNLNGQQADILVSHEAPSCHPHGFTAIDQLAQSMKVKRSFHGHHHDCLDYSQHEKKLGFKPHGVGLRGVTDLDGNVIRAGQLDEQRMSRGNK